MTNLKHEGVHQAMLRLRAEGPRAASFGICHEYYNVNPPLPEEWLPRAFERLGLTNFTYPVPSGEAWRTSCDAYRFTRGAAMWDKETPYGANRWALVYALADLANGVQVSSVDWPYPETGVMED